ncbi:MAG: hypothetical protein D6816_00620 [Bacteroidetes bacterium]|nr:MAG: hypothetical protein D6816_00620 [Bacteroidota bacterium]
MFTRWHVPVIDLRFPCKVPSKKGYARTECCTGIGDRALLSKKRTALFCSRQCPGSLILCAHEWAKRCTRHEAVIVSGFHTPVEQECLRLFLRRGQPVIVCPARGLNHFRIPAAYRDPLIAGTLLLLSPFDGTIRRVTRAHAARRNAWVAALAHQVVFIHAALGSQTEQLFRNTLAKGKRCFTFDHPANEHLITAGADPLESAC